MIYKGDALGVRKGGDTNAGSHDTEFDTNLGNMK